MYDVTIIGCGIVGAATAYELCKYDLRLAILEKENDVAVGATKANSAIIHAGYDPTPGTLMAKLNVQGNALARKIFNTLDIPYKQCGALVLAFSAEEVATLHSLYENGRANGVPDISILTKEEVLDKEPNISDSVMAALYAPTTMIVSPWEYGLAMAETAVLNGAELKRECEVMAIEKLDEGFMLKTSQGSIQSRYIINAAGLFADNINNMITDDKFAIVPDRGEYFLLDKNEGNRVNTVIFQCPTKLGKGVLVAPTVHGNLIVGPNAVEIDGHDTSTTAAGLADVRELAQKSVPGIDFRANIRNFAGIRAKTNGGDFIINQPQKGFINLAGISSPGLSAAPAIAKMALEMLELPLSQKKEIIDKRDVVRFNKLSPQDKADLIAKDKNYSTVICRCETVTEGEILAALHSPIPPRSVDGVKRRTGAGMGRCQSGFCGPRVVEILAKHYNCPPTEILQDGAGTHILVEETKRGKIS